MTTRECVCMVSSKNAMGGLSLLLVLCIGLHATAANSSFTQELGQGRLTDQQTGSYVQYFSELCIHTLAQFCMLYVSACFVQQERLEDASIATQSSHLMSSSATHTSTQNLGWNAWLRLHSVQDYKCSGFAAQEVASSKMGVSLNCYKTQRLQTGSPKSASNHKPG